MGRKKASEPYRRKHTSFAMNEKEYSEIHILCKSLDISRSQLIRELIAKKYDEIIKDRYLNLDLKGVEND